MREIKPPTITTAIPTPVVILAWAAIHGPEEQRRASADELARRVLEVAQ